jgi:hypothetical protein
VLDNSLAFLITTFTMSPVKFRNFFQIRGEGRFTRAVCTICHKSLPNNAGSMSNHYRWTHLHRGIDTSNSVNHTTTNTPSRSCQPEETDHPLSYVKMLVTGPRSAIMYPSETESSTDVNDTPSQNMDDTSASNEVHDEEVSDVQTDEDDTSPEEHLEKRGANITKRTVKYLAVCMNPQTYQDVVEDAADEVIRTICNAAYNVQQGSGVHLTPSQKTLFRAHRDTILDLSSKNVGIKAKREMIASQTGGFPFIPILIGSALGALGSRLFGGTQQQ